MINDACHYCGHEPQGMTPEDSLLTKGRKDKRDRYNGIDRMDNTIGYVVENCVPCCSPCNRAKWVMSKREFLDLVKAVYDHSLVYRKD